MPELNAIGIVSSDLAASIAFYRLLAPVLRDHVPDAERDLVLGEQGDSLHAEA